VRRAYRPSRRRRGVVDFGCAVADRAPRAAFPLEQRASFEDDDHLVLDVAETTAAGSAAPALSDAVLWLDIARSVR
jgi:hypothetical protein